MHFPRANCKFLDILSLLSAILTFWPGDFRRLVLILF